MGPAHLTGMFPFFSSRTGALGRYGWHEKLLPLHPSPLTPGGGELVRQAAWRELFAAVIRRVVAARALNRWHSLSRLCTNNLLPGTGWKACATKVKNFSRPQLGM